MVCPPTLAQAAAEAENADVQHFKILSTVEYSGQGQFRSHAETRFTARKQSLPNDKVRYLLSASGVDLAGSGSSSGEVSFVIDRKTKYLSQSDQSLALWQRINNACVSSLEKVTKENVGKTWKQSFELPFAGNSLPAELKFTLTAIQLKTEAFGEVIAVRALSEPFVFQITKNEGGTGPVKSKVSAVYLFDQDVEDVYLSISVFEATTSVNGSKETLRHEVAVYRTDAAGESVDLNGLSKKFERLVQKVGLTRKGIKVEKEVPLPGWAQTEGLRAAGVANMYAAMACEGAPNPVAAVCIPASRIVELQSFGKLVAISKIGTVSAMLSQGIPAIGALNMVAIPAIMGVGLGTAAAIVGGGVAVAAGGGGGGRDRSPCN